MVTNKEVMRQFRQLKVKPSMWAKGEIEELTRILEPGECLTHVVFGWYNNGFALLCCTEHRVLLIDKKPFYLKLEDLRYDKISEVKFVNRMLDSLVVLSYAGMTLEFKSWNQSAMRKLTDFVQQTITMINRQQWYMGPDSGQYAQQTYNTYAQINPFQSQEMPPVQPSVPVQPAQENSVSQGLMTYPEDLANQAALDLGLMKNPYIPTNKFIRRRIPLLGFNQTSR